MSPVLNFLSSEGELRVLVPKKKSVLIIPISFYVHSCKELPKIIKFDQNVSLMFVAEA
jgi:hypothetical protein